jgi:hypothetical protein
MRRMKDGMRPAPSVVVALRAGALATGTVRAQSYPERVRATTTLQALASATRRHLDRVFPMTGNVCRQVDDCTT